MRNVLTAGVKTGVQVGVAALISWLASVGIEVAGETAQLLETGAFMVGTAIIAAFLNWLESKFPVLSKIFSLGLAQSPATYAPTG